MYWAKGAAEISCWEYGGEMGKEGSVHGPVKEGSVHGPQSSSEPVLLDFELL